MGGLFLFLNLYVCFFLQKKLQEIEELSLERQ